jgi:PAS domain S-box-containing protein
MFEDITQRKKAEVDIQQHTKELASLLRISQCFTTSLELEKVLQMSIDEAVKLLELGSGAIYLVEKDELYLGATTPPLPSDFPEEFRRANINDHPHIQKAITTKNPVILDDILKADLSPAEKGISEARNLRTILYVPLIGHDNIIGVYIVGSVGEPVEISESKVNLSLTLSNQASLAILDARLFEELKEGEEKYRLLHENAGLGIGYWTPDGKVISFNKIASNTMDGEQEDFIGKSVLELFGYEQGSIFMKRLEQAGESGESQSFEDLVNTPNGEKWFLSIFSRIVDSNGKVLGIQVISDDITERKRFEEKILEKEYLLSKAQEIGLIGTWELDIVNDVLVWTDENYRIFGVTKGTPLTYKIFLNCVHPEDRDSVHKEWTHGIKNNDYDIVHRIIVADQVKWVREKAEITYDDNGNPIKATGFTQDVTDRIKAETALSESEKLLRESQEVAMLGSYVFYISKGLWVSSEVLDTIFGIDKDFERSVEGWSSIVHPEWQQTMVDYLTDDVIGKKGRFDKEYKIIRKNDGEERWVHGFGELELNSQGQPIKMIGTIQDITDRKKAEELFKGSALEYQTLFESMREGFALCEVIQDETGAPVDYRFIKINPAFSEQSGMDIDKTIGKTIKEVYPDIEPVWIQRYGNVAITQKSIHFEDYNHNTDRYYDAIAYSPEKGKFAMIFRDITDRKKAEEALQASEQKHRTLYETMTQGVVYQDVDGNIISANSAAEEVLGLTIDQMMGRTSMDPRWKSIHEDGSDFPGDTHPSMVALKTGEEVRNVVMGVFHPDKERHVWININAVPQFKSGENKPYQVYTTFEDITNRVETEEHIRASLHEKELLLKEIHHRVKNNLQVISSMLSLQSMHIMDDDLKAMFRESQGRVQTMAIVHEKMYQSPDLSKIGFAEYLKDLTHELFASYGVDSSQITSNVDVADIKLGVDVAIPCGLIVNELISNSLKHAFPNGEKGEIKVNLVRDNEDKFNLVVGDNGVGFPKGIDFKQMESLGLRLVNTLVDQLKGTIELDNEGGTKFKIEFRAPEELKGLR